MTNEAIERAVALRRQQVSYRAIAAIMGWSLPTVLKHVRAAMGAEAGDCRRRASRSGAAVQMRSAGASYEAIAASPGYPDARQAGQAVNKYRARHGPKAARPVPAVRAAPTPRAVPPVPPIPVDHIWHELPASRTYHCAGCGMEVRTPTGIEWTCAEWRAEQGARRRGRAIGAGGRVVG